MFLQSRSTVFGTSVCRLGLATRGESELVADDVHCALARGVNFLNWPGCDDVLSRTIADLGPRRTRVVVCAQFSARTATEARTELRFMLRALQSDYIDVLTFYYVEQSEEWHEICSPGGALAYCEAARRDGQVRLLGLTTHQRTLAVEAAQSGRLDLLMIRYNAAHRGAESAIFPVTQARGMPVIAYTALRWGTLMRPTPDDPPGFVVPAAPAWYRFVLQSPAVTVALIAPHNRAELDQDLTVLEPGVPLLNDEFEHLAAHGRRVRRHGGAFP